MNGAIKHGRRGGIFGTVLYIPVPGLSTCSYPKLAQPVLVEEAEYLRSACSQGERDERAVSDLLISLTKLQQTCLCPQTSERKYIPK